MPSVKRAFDIAFIGIVLAIVGFLLFERLRPFDSPALTGDACTMLDWPAVREIHFESIRNSQSRARPGGVQVRTDPDAPGQSRCRQIGGRIDCTVTGPTTVRVIAGSEVRHYAVEAGQDARVRAQSRGDRIACAVG